METVKASLAAMGSSMTTISEKEILIDCPLGSTEGSPVSSGGVKSTAEEFITEKVKASRLLLEVS